MMKIKRNRKLIGAVCSALLLTSLLAACQTTDKVDRDAGFPITISLDWTPNTNHTGIYVAEAKDYFAEAGLDVTIIQPAENSAVSLTASGQAQFGIDAQDTMAAALAIDEPLDVVAVAAILQHNTSGIISRAGEGLDTASGLVGKRYSTWNNPIELAMIEHLVTADGGQFADVTLIPNTVSDEAAALRSNQTDAIWIFYGWSGINAEQSGLDFDYYHFADLNPVFDYYTPLVIANQSFLDEHPEEAAAFISALSRGYNYAVDHPEEAANILIEGDDTGSLAGARELVQKSQAWISEQYKSGVEVWGQIDQARWDRFYTWLYEEGLIENELSPGSGFTNEFLPNEESE